MSSEDRRGPGTTRIPFEGLVEVGGAMGPSFEAQAVDVSEDGMKLRTAYLPEAGQPLTCRFDASTGQSVLASGEVVWTQGAEKGGEFAIRFTEMDAESVDSLKSLCGVSGSEPAAVPPGSKVRLHIDGLASPMRAKIRDSRSSEVTVGSELGFLQVGRHLELEDAQSGTKRAAAIDRVEVEVDPASNVPQLVVTLRYEGAATRPSGVAEARAAGPSATPRSDDDLRSMEEASAQMKGSVARSFARVGPAMERLASRAKTTLALLAKRRAEGAVDPGAPRRTTSPAPGGGLHAAGKRVVRGESAPAADEAGPARKLQMTKRNGAIAGAVMLTAILGAIAIKKSHHEPPVDTASAATPDTSAAAALAAPPPSPTFPPALPASPAPPLDAVPPTGLPPSTGNALASGDDGAQDSSDKPAHKKHTHVASFGNGPVHHANVLHLKMDGAIEAIEGAAQPTGFAVKIPGRKSLDAAGPLAARDARIAAIKVANGSAGAELTLAFKDGVPNYQVSAKGDTLLIALAPPGETVASKTEASTRGGKHHKGPLKKP